MVGHEGRRPVGRLDLQRDRGRGGGLSDMFGGGVTSNLGASGVAERNLNRITVILGLVWVACIIVLGLIIKFSA